jgi:hypothetical protein
MLEKDNIKCHKKMIYFQIIGCTRGYKHKIRDYYGYYEELNESIIVNITRDFCTKAITCKYKNVIYPIGHKDNPKAHVIYKLCNSYYVLYIYWYAYFYNKNYGNYIFMIV